MLNQLANVQVWVHDQDEALAFYTDKLGMEVRSDVTLPEMGDFRWLTVGPADQPDIAIVLMAIPGPPVIDDESEVGTFTKPTSLQAPGSKKRSNRVQAMTGDEDSVPSAAELAVGDRSGTVEFDPEVDGIEDGRPHKELLQLGTKVADHLLGEVIVEVAFGAAER